MSSLRFERSSFVFWTKRGEGAREGVTRASRAGWWPGTDERDRLHEDCRTRPCSWGEARALESKEKEVCACGARERVSLYIYIYISREGWARVGKVRGYKSYFS